MRLSQTQHLVLYVLLLLAGVVLMAAADARGLTAIGVGLFAGGIGGTLRTVARWKRQRQCSQAAHRTGEHPTFRSSVAWDMWALLVERWQAEPGRVQAQWLEELPGRWEDVSREYSAVDVQLDPSGVARGKSGGWMGRSLMMRRSYGFGAVIVVIVSIIVQRFVFRVTFTESIAPAAAAAGGYLIAVVSLRRRREQASAKRPSSE
jgi:hypothetical protein